MAFVPAATRDTSSAVRFLAAKVFFFSVVAAVGVGEVITLGALEGAVEVEDAPTLGVAAADCGLGLGAVEEGGGAAAEEVLATAALSEDGRVGLAAEGLSLWLPFALSLTPVAPPGGGGATGLGLGTPAVVAPGASADDGGGGVGGGGTVVCAA